MIRVSDIETRSRCGLRQHGSRRYAADPSTEVLLTAATGGWVYGLDRTPSVVHNASFEAAFGIPVLADTMAHCAYNGLPMGLDKAAHTLWQVGKDEAGARLMLSLCKPRKDGRFLPINDANLTRLAAYAMRDVDLTERLYRELHLPARERDHWRATHDANCRGIRVDTDLARAIIEADARNRRDDREAAGVGAAVLRSPKQIGDLLADAGFPVPDCRRATLEALLPDVPEDLAHVIRARIGANRVAAAKATAILDRQHGGRIHDTLCYYAAHTGRWGGRGVQLQNLPRPAKGLDIPGARARCLAGDRCTDDELAALVRACLLPDGEVMTVADYASIEARVEAWLTGDRSRLAMYRDGIDVYVDMASRVFGVPREAVTAGQRFVGKTLVLGCGYQMGAERFAAHAEAVGLDLAAAGLSAEAAVEAYRDSRPILAGVRRGGRWREGGMWRALGHAVWDAVESGRDTAIARCVVYRSGPHLRIRLPSDRDLIYRDAAILPQRTRYGVRDQVVYQTPRGPRSLYGGKVLENVTQAVSRDILAEAVLILGDRVLTHVHDEILANGRDTVVPAMIQAGERVAPGCPIGVEEFRTPWYTKG